MGYRRDIAEENKDTHEAMRLQAILTQAHRQRAAPYLKPDAALDDDGQHWLRTLAVSLEHLGHIQREMGLADCVKSFKEAVALEQHIEDRALEAIAAFNLGHAYLTISAIRDLNQAEQWYQRSLELHLKEDNVGRGRCLRARGLVQFERFREARAAKKMEDAARYLAEAAEYSEQALGLFPAGAVDDLAVTHNHLGAIYTEYTDAKLFERGMAHYDQAIRLNEQSGKLYEAGRTRYNVALALRRQGRFENALLYAGAALRNFESYEGRAAQDKDDTRRLIADIEADLRKQQGGG